MTWQVEHIEQMLSCLFDFAERDEDGVRNVVAECFGKLAAVASEAVLPRLEEHLAHPSALIRAAVVSSVRFTITEPGCTPIPPASMRKFLSLLADADLKVRRGAILALNCVAHNWPASVSEELGGLLPLLYSETIKKNELVHQVIALPPSAYRNSRLRDIFLPLLPNLFLALQKQIVWMLLCERRLR